MAALAVAAAVTPREARASDIGVSASVSLESNQMFRGETISRDEPGATFGIDLDGPGGTFAGAETSVSAGASALRVTASSQFAGIAFRAGPAALEAGMIHRHYLDNVDTDYHRDFVEFFAGARLGRVRARLFVAPAYLREGGASYYLDGQARVIAKGQWSLSAHAGLSLIPYHPGSGRRGLRDYLDGSVTLTRMLGPLALSASVARTNYPVISRSGRRRVWISLSRSF